MSRELREDLCDWSFTRKERPMEKAGARSCCTLFEFYSQEISRLLEGLKQSRDIV